MEALTGSRRREWDKAPGWVSDAFEVDLRRQGFAFVERHRPEISTLDIADRIGLREDIAGIPPVQTLRPKSVATSTGNLYSGNFGLGAFPYHTDLAHWFIPPRYILLRCQRGHDQVYTSVLGCELAVTGLSLGAIQRARFRPRRSWQGHRQLLPFAQPVGTQSLLRWDSLFIVPDNADAVVVAARLKALDLRTTGEQFVLRHPGDTLIIDNWRVLHGRGPVHDGAHERLIERIYLREIISNG